MLRPLEIAYALRKWRIEHGLTQSQIAIALGQSQSWVSRVLSGEFKRLTPAVIALCEYADVVFERQSERSEEGFARLSDALDAVWDGTEVDARRIEKLLRAVSQLRHHR